MTPMAQNLRVGVKLSVVGIFRGCLVRAVILLYSLSYFFLHNSCSVSLLYDGKSVSILYFMCGNL